MRGYPGKRQLLLAAAILLGGCASLGLDAPRALEREVELEARLQSVLAKRGHPDGLSLIDRQLKARFPTPRFTPPLVRELLARPAQAADAAAMFERAVPRSLADFIAALSRPANVASAPVALRPLIDAYANELLAAQAALRGALKGAALDPKSVLTELEEDLPSLGAAAIAPSIDEAALGRATDAFISATARFTLALRNAGPRLQFPEAAQRFDSPIGTVVIGTRGKDRHPAGAALIVDPGGDDEYARAPVTGAGVSVIIDLGGNDRYTGSDLAIHGLAAIVDFSGDDRYDSAGPGLGAAVAGVSLLVDLQGDDVYAAQRLAQGAALYGLGALVDLAGNDQYSIDAGGQGFGHTGGVGLLWDLAGNDQYRAAGLKDEYDRGGRISMAQGAGFGVRPGLGGGIGVLRDDEGDDRYQAEMFAQGTGYYFAAGLLWDRAGNDQYRAVRYAQGNGTHQAVGVLADAQGDDRYALTVGVGQGMGLDLAVGVLVDEDGVNEFSGPGLVQGSGTANGIGVLVTGGRKNLFRTPGVDKGNWGNTPNGERCLPTFGILLYDERASAFEADSRPFVPPPDSAGFGGPGGLEPQPLQGCIKPARSPEGTSPSR
jgi:hypothetical protein